MRNEHVVRDLVEGMRLGDLCALINVASSEISYKEVGDTMAIGQPAVSARIRRLEACAGLLLKVERRRGAAFGPTPAGEEIVAAGKDLLDKAVGLARLVLELRARLNEQVVRLAGGATATNVLIPRILGQLYSQHRDLTVAVTNIQSQEVISGIYEGRYDLGIVSAEVVGRRNQDRLEWREWIKDEYVLAVPTNHRLATDMSFDWAGLEGERLFVIERSGIRLLMCDTAKKMGQSAGKLRIQELPSVHACGDSTQSGAGLTFVSSLLANNADRLIRGVRVLPCQERMVRTLFLVRDRHVTPTPHQTAVWEHLVASGPNLCETKRNALSTAMIVRQRRLRYTQRRYHGHPMTVQSVSRLALQKNLHIHK